MALVGRAVNRTQAQAQQVNNMASASSSHPMMTMTSSKLEPYNAYAALQQHTSMPYARASIIQPNGYNTTSAAAAFPLLSLAVTALSPSTTATATSRVRPVSATPVNGSTAKLRATTASNGIAVPSSATIAGIVGHGVTPVLATKAVIRSSLASPSMNASVPVQSAPLLSLAAHALSPSSLSLPPASATSSALVAAGAAAPIIQQQQQQHQQVHYQHQVAHASSVATTPSQQAVNASTRHSTRAATAAAISEPKKATANHRLSAPAAQSVSVLPTTTPRIVKTAPPPVMVRADSPIDDDDERDASVSPPTVGGGGGDKVKKRLARKAELARASRRRKKAYVSDLEAKVTQLSARVAELERELQLRGGVIPPVAGTTKSRGRSTAVKATKSTPPPVQVPATPSRTATPSRSQQQRGARVSDVYEQQQQQVQQQHDMDHTNDDGDGASSPSSSIDDAHHSTASLSPPLTPMMTPIHHSPMMYPSINGMHASTTSSPPHIAAATTATAATPAIDSAMALVLASSNYGYVMPPAAILPAASLAMTKEEEKECKSDANTQWLTPDQKEEEKEVKMPDNEMKRMQRQLLNGSKANSNNNGNIYSHMYAQMNGNGHTYSHHHHHQQQHNNTNGDGSGTYNGTTPNGKRRFESSVTMNGGASSSLINYGSVGEAKLEPVMPHIQHPHPFIPSSVGSSGKHDDSTSEEKRVNNQSYTSIPNGNSIMDGIPPLEQVIPSKEALAAAMVGGALMAMANDVERMTKRARVDETMPTPAAVVTQ